MTTLVVTGSHDYSQDNLTNITEIDFNNLSAATITFAASQFDGTHIATNVHIVVNGTVQVNEIDIAMSSPTTFSAANWTFTNWGVGFINYLGSSGVDHITGANVNEGFNVTAGDVLMGGSGADSFTIASPSALAAGGQINGGAGSYDSLSVGGVGTFDFTQITLTGIEQIAFFGAGAVTALFTAAELSGVTFVQFVDSSYVENFNVSGSSINLSGINFQSDSANDTIKLTGTSGNDTLTGSYQNDTFVGGAGNDTMSGGEGNDLFFYNGTPDVATGTTSADSVDGGNGFDQLAITATTDFSNTHASFSSIEGLAFQLASPGSAIFRSDEFGTGLISSSLAVTGDTTTDTVVVSVQSGATFSAGNWTFTNWSGSDLVSLTGAAGNESITGSSQNDTIFGLGGNDTLNGGGGNDTLTGGAGGDTLTGGAGNDTFVYQHTNDGVDTITDFTVGQDMFQLSASGFSLSAGTLSHAGVSFVLGTSAVASGPEIVYSLAGDVYWDADGTGNQPSSLLANVGSAYTATGLGGNTDWVVAATGDFNHDGTADIIWRSNSSGQDLLWLMNNGQMTQTINLGGNTDWKVATTGDFNGDGTVDIVWRSTSSGQDLLWTMSNGQPTATTNIGGNTDWSPVATGDFNHDGTTDIIWRSASSGQDLLWLMNNGQMTQTIDLGGNTDWQVSATGDFNGDGTADIIWRSNSSGADLLWLMSNGQPTSTTAIGGNLDWRPIVAGDFNHDGIDDIIWHSSSSGANIMWTMVNGQPIAQQTIGGDTNSQPVATGDFNHDGYSDIVWHTNATGTDLLWTMGAHPAITADQFTIA